MPSLLLLLAGPALAFDVLKTADLASRVAEVSAQAGGPILVAAAGPEADRLLTHLSREQDVPWKVQRVPLVGDVPGDMARVLNRAGLSCAIRVSPGGMEGEWLASLYGSCGDLKTDANGWLPPDDSARRPPTEDEPAFAIPVVAEAPPLDVGRALLLAKTVPDPTTALLSSAIVGFGAGHFYADDPRSAWVHLGVQTGGLLIFGIARAAESAALYEEDAQTARIFAALGLSVTIGSRLVDAGTAPGAAQEEARRQIELQLP